MSKGKSKLGDFWGEIVSDLKTPFGLLVAVFFVLVLITLALSVFLAVEVSSLRTHTTEALGEVEGAIQEFSQTLELSKPGNIDLSISGAQPLNPDFLVVDIGAQPKEGGVMVSGGVINSSALDHYQVHFKVVFDDGREADFVIGALRSGHSSKFEVMVPPAGNKSVPDMAKIKYIGSEVSYH